MKTGSNNGEVTYENIFDENMLSIKEKVGDEKTVLNGLRDLVSSWGSGLT